ncbi:hypothetical protein [Nannocystis bainbridge]|uniref:Secreted protein n=1 Tax=Nannocystis bainbridge TaxID=2995303 RepID=A0ABT5ECF0_9BACT|nr:hypothetical protein [Nannocystis bainbridge]MDC0723550.1 hypothetical protein [Nannocystis bainbridge]
MIARISPLLLVGLLSLSGCKEDGATANSAISELPVNKKVSDLTAAEQQQLCEGAAAFVAREITPDDVRRALCSLQGILIAGTLGDGSVDACVTARDECLGSPEEPGAVEAGGKGCELAWDTCATTIGELDACMEEVVTELEALYKELDCGNIKNYQGKMPSPEPELGEACQRVQNRCPGFLPGNLLTPPEGPPTS